MENLHGKHRKQKGLRMAEGRMIKKRISKSLKFAHLKNDKTRTLYLLLLPHTDVDGRLEANSSIVKGEVCPYISTLTIKNIPSCLKELHESGLICLYEFGGEKFLQVQRFHDFNKVSATKEATSRIPPPTPEQLQSYSGVTPAEVKLSKVKLSISKENGVCDFENFWKEYPKKKSKGQAESTWNKLKKQGTLPELAILHDAIAAAKAGQDWLRDNGQYIPYPSTWLNAKGWEDEVKVDLKIKKPKFCFVCRESASESVSTFYGKADICPKCLELLHKAPHKEHFKTGSQIPKSSMSKDELEKMILAQKGGEK